MARRPGGLSTKPNEAAVHELKPLYIGQDPRDVHALWERMHQGLFLHQNAAMSGIEMACWDILGKSLNTPVWRLLGGKVRPRLRAYANGWYQGPRDPKFFGERVAVGDSVDVLIEGHDRFSVSTATEVSQALADFKPMWFETPVMSTEVGMARYPYADRNFLRLFESGWERRESGR